MRGHPAFTLFPYTTLFRSGCACGSSRKEHDVPWLTGDRRGSVLPTPQSLLRSVYAGRLCVAIAIYLTAMATHSRRSEEHTSELQSRENLVCRLLLEKKN